MHIGDKQPSVLRTITHQELMFFVFLFAVRNTNCLQCLSEAAMSNPWPLPHSVTVILDSWRAVINDNISGLFLKSQNKESAASTKASFIISPS